MRRKWVAGINSPIICAQPGMPRNGKAKPESRIESSRGLGGIKREERLAPLMAGLDPAILFCGNKEDARLGGRA